MRGKDPGTFDGSCMGHAIAHLEAESGEPLEAPWRSFLPAKAKII